MNIGPYCASCVFEMGLRFMCSFDMEYDQSTERAYVTCLIAIESHDFFKVRFLKGKQEFLVEVAILVHDEIKLW